MKKTWYKITKMNFDDVLNLDLKNLNQVFEKT